MDRKLIIIIAVFVIAAIAIFAYSLFNQQQDDMTAGEENNKLNTSFNFTPSAKGSSERTDQFYLKGQDGNPIANANVSATYKSNNKEKTIILTTNDEGYSKYVISGMDNDSKDIIYKYDGNDKYKSCEAKHSITN